MSFLASIGLADESPRWQRAVALASAWHDKEFSVSGTVKVRNAMRAWLAKVEARIQLIAPPKTSMLEFDGETTLLSEWVTLRRESPVPADAFRVKPGDVILAAGETATFTFNLSYYKGRYSLDMPDVIELIGLRLSEAVTGSTRTVSLRRHFRPISKTAPKVRGEVSYA